MSLRFHWRMIHGGETAGVPRGTQNRLIEMSRPDLVAQAEFCRLGTGLRDRVAPAGLRLRQAGSDSSRRRAGTGRRRHQIHRCLPVRLDVAGNLRAAAQHALEPDRRALRLEYRCRPLTGRATLLRRLPGPRPSLRPDRRIPRGLSRVLAMRKGHRLPRTALSD